MRNIFPQIKDDVIYLDSAATTMTHVGVINKIQELLTQTPSNPGRGINSIGGLLLEQIEATRQLIAKSYGIEGQEHRVIFNYGVTDGMNKLARILKTIHINEYSMRDLSTTILKYNHHSSLLPWQLSNDNRFIKVNRYGNILNLQEITGEIFVVPEIHNVTGAEILTPDMCDKCYQQGTYLIVDAAQSYAHGTKELHPGIDAYLCSFHKGYGFSGTGFMILSDRLLEFLPPTFGGGGVDIVSTKETKLLPPPASWEVGTQPYHALIANKESHEYITTKPGHGPSHRLFREELLKMDFNLLNAPESTSISAFNHPKIDVTTIATYLDHNNIVVRSGQHCVGLFAEDYGSTIRISTGPYNTENDLTKLIDVLKRMFHVAA